MFHASPHPLLVASDRRVDLDDAPTMPEGGARKDDAERLEGISGELEELQRALYADERWALLAIFQGRDAAGKDGTIRQVFRQCDPAGVHVTAFGAPTAQELRHDFLWRTSSRLPERGHIGIFNRSYYEEVIVARARPEFLVAQQLPDGPSTATDPGAAFWQQRFDSIREHELHLARNGTAIVKFFLNVSWEEQRQRLLDRLEEPDKHWKFDEDDLQAREHWDEYTHAYTEAINATTAPWAPWYVIPADDKGAMRVQVAEIVVAALGSLGLRPADGRFDRPIEELRAVLKSQKRRRGD